MSDRTKIILSGVVGMGIGLIFTVHPRTWTLGMFIVNSFFWIGLGLFLGWKTEIPKWLIEVMPSLGRKFFQS